MPRDGRHARVPGVRSLTSDTCHFPGASTVRVFIGFYRILSDSIGRRRIRRGAGFRAVTGFGEGMAEACGSRTHRRSD